MHVSLSPLRRWAATLKFKIVLVVVATCVLSAAGTAALVLASSQSSMERLLIDNAADDRERTAALLASKVVMLKGALMAVTRQVPAPLWQDPEGMGRHLIKRPVINAMFDSVFAASADGRMLTRLEKGVPAADLPNVADRDYFKQAMRSGQPVISSVLRGKVSKRPIILFAVPALDDDGLATGVLAGSLTLQSTALFMDSRNGSRDAESRDLVIDRAGTILSHPDPSRVMGRAEDDPGLGPMVRAWLASGSRIDAEGSASVGQGYLISWAGIPSTDWINLRLTPAELAFEPVAAARSMAWRAATGVGVLAALLAGWLAYRLTQPISQLRRRAEALLDPLAPPQPWAPGQGEVGELARAFQHVVEQRQHQQAEVQALVSQLEAVLDHAEVGIALTRDGCFELVSRNFCHVFRCSKADMVGQPTRRIYASDEAFQALAERARPAFMADGAFDGELELMRRTGQLFWGRLRGRAVVAGDMAQGTIWTVEDVTTARDMREQLTYTASHDALTGLANRSAFEAALEEATRTVAVVPFCTLFIDLDRFKAVNDSGGHAAGDALLRGIAQALESQVRRSDLVARLGGDEFAVLLSACPPAQAQQIADKLCAAVAAYRLVWEGQCFAVGASVGLVNVTPEFNTSADVLRAADAACYAAKRRGRNRVEVHAALALGELAAA